MAVQDPITGGAIFGFTSNNLTIYYIKQMVSLWFTVVSQYRYVTGDKITTLIRKSYGIFFVSHSRLAARIVDILVKKISSNFGN